MQELIERIRKDGRIKPGNVLKVDSFLNHQIDPKLAYAMAQEIKRLYADETVNKVLTIEASGIGLAVLTGYLFECPVVFAEKKQVQQCVRRPLHGKSTLLYPRHGSHRHRVKVVPQPRGQGAHRR